MESMHFGHALDHLVWSIVHADPTYGPVFLSKTDLKDGFYRVYLAPRDAAKLGVVFPSLPGEPPLIAIPLALSMGWKNSLPIFSTATETIADVTNQEVTILE
jgi:hypothetical protein